MSILSDSRGPEIVDRQTAPPNYRRSSYLADYRPDNILFAFTIHIEDYIFVSQVCQVP